MYLGIDLGSTNIKAAIYDSNMHLVDRRSIPVSYIREQGFVEFDAVEYVQNLIALLKEMFRANRIHAVSQIAFTGQAESLIIVDKDGCPLMNGISWMDERSTAECEILSSQFSLSECEAVTGQQAILPTWPATKILWLQRNCHAVYNQAAHYLLLKDYVVYYLTGIMAADMSIATFSFYFDIYQKCYWKKMLDAIGITEAQLPPLVEPCSTVGTLRKQISEALGLENRPSVNVGTLDHFAGMIGTGNTKPGGITLSTGTVMAMAVMANAPVVKNTGIAMHYGFRPDTYVMLPVAESGGISLEWFKNTCMPNIGYDQMNSVLSSRGRNQLLFLPYLVGTNAPEFDSGATGVFWGLRQEHDVYDMAYAVMEGVCFVLRKNCEAIAAKGTNTESIVATGGGAKSPVWCQLQADITGKIVRIPDEKEAACLGAAIIAAVADGKYATLDDSAELVSFSREFIPHPTPKLERKYHQFSVLYNASLSLPYI